MFTFSKRTPIESEYDSFITFLLLLVFAKLFFLPLSPRRLTVQALSSAINLLTARRKKNFTRRDFFSLEYIFAYSLFSERDKMRIHKALKSLIILTSTISESTNHKLFLLLFFLLPSSVASSGSLTCCCEIKMFIQFGARDSYFLLFLFAALTFKSQRKIYVFTFNDRSSWALIFATRFAFYDNIIFVWLTMLSSDFEN